MLWQSPYFQNVASDFITLAILLALGGVAYRTTQRRRLLSFFQCRGERRVVLYLSNLSLDRGASKDARGTPRAFAGSAVPSYELDLVAPAYRLFLAPVPGLEGQKGFLALLALKDLEVHVTPSPLDPNAIDQTGTLVAIGSAAYNVVSGLADDPAAAPMARLNPDTGQIVLIKSGSTFFGGQYGLLQKVFLPCRNQWLFCAAGPNRNGTTAAYFYLMNNWRRLAGQFGADTPFALVLELGSAGARTSRVVATDTGEPPGRGDSR